MPKPIATTPYKETGDTTYSDGSVVSRLKGRIHGDGGRPAIRYKNGNVYAHRGKYHRAVGPAIIHKDGTSYGWYFFGQEVETITDYVTAVIDALVDKYSFHETEMIPFYRRGGSVLKNIRTMPFDSAVTILSRMFDGIFKHYGTPEDSDWSGGEHRLSETRELVTFSMFLAEAGEYDWNALIKKLPHPDDRDSFDYFDPWEDDDGSVHDGEDDDDDDEEDAAPLTTKQLVPAVLRRLASIGWKQRA